jgi:hypothetical protein
VPAVMATGASGMAAAPAAMAASATTASFGIYKAVPTVKGEQQGRHQENKYGPESFERY